jgi:hypothetical protein
VQELSAEVEVLAAQDNEPEIEEVEVEPYRKHWWFAPYSQWRGDR